MRKIVYAISVLFLLLISEVLFFSRCATSNNFIVVDGGLVTTSPYNNSIEAKETNAAKETSPVNANINNQYKVEESKSNVINATNKTLDSKTNVQSSLSLEEQIQLYYRTLAIQTLQNLSPAYANDETAINITHAALMQEDTINNKKDENGIYNDLGKKYKKGKYLGKFMITGYCSCNKCCGKWSNQTASGATTIVKHTIATDKNVIKTKTNIIIDGGETDNIENYNGIYRAEDTGGAVKGNMIDIYRPTHLEAQAVTHSGRQYAYVYEAIPIE